MPDRYILRGKTIEGETIPSWPCPTEHEALLKAGAYFDAHGQEARLEILLNDLQPPLWNASRLAKWNEEGRPLPQS